MTKQQERQPQRLASVYRDDGAEIDLSFSEKELSGKNAIREEPQPTSNEDDSDFENVDLALTEEELTRKNSFDFVIEEKKHFDEIHDLLYGKPRDPRLTVPAPSVSGSRTEVRRARNQPEQVEIEMTDFSRERDLEAVRSTTKKSPGKKDVTVKESGVAM